MNSFMNPAFLINIAKNYLSDINRIWNFNSEQLKKYQDKSFRKIVKYAYTVPLYNKKYKECNIRPDDIKGIDDIDKLPIITKDDLKRNYPNNITPKGIDKKNYFVLSTSGSTGSPVFFYYDRLALIKALGGYVRALNTYGKSWYKSRIALLVDVKPGSIDHAVFKASVIPFLEKFVSLKNIKLLHVGEKDEDLLKELNDFNPEFIGSDPAMLRKIASLKNEGLGKNINPSNMSSSGAMLDKYTKQYVEKAFGTKLYNMYGSTESGLLAFECLKSSNLHVNGDFVYMEFLDDKNKPVSYGKPGHVVITRLFGQGTPIVRYSGLGDMVIPIENKGDCSISSQMIEHIEGRTAELIVLPNGKKIAPFEFTDIPAAVMQKLNTYKIKQFQIIQHKVDEIEVLIVIEDRLRNTGPSVEKILKEIKKLFIEKTDELANITINEVDELEKDVRSDYVKLLISKVEQSNGN